jgi:hypothetical protein
MCKITLANLNLTKPGFVRKYRPKLFHKISPRFEQFLSPGDLAREGRMEDVARGLPPVIVQQPSTIHFFRQLEPFVLVRKGVLSVLAKRFGKRFDKLFGKYFWKLFDKYFSRLLAKKIANFLDNILAQSEDNGRKF